MEQTRIMKGVALFTTLIAIYQWLGNGTSLFDIIILLLSTALIINIDKQEAKEDGPVPEHVGDIQKNKNNFFCRLRRIIAEPISRLAAKRELEPFYSFALN